MANGLYLTIIEWGWARYEELLSPKFAVINRSRRLRFITANWGLDNSSYCATIEFNNCFIIYLKNSKQTKAICILFVLRKKQFVSPSAPVVVVILMASASQHDSRRHSNTTSYPGYFLLYSVHGHLLRKYPGIVWSRVSQNLGGNNKFLLGWVTKYRFVTEQGVSEEITQKSCRKYLQDCIFYLSWILSSYTIRNIKFHCGPECQWVKIYQISIYKVWYTAPRRNCTTSQTLQENIFPDRPM
jgi:hypothetical protein